MKRFIICFLLFLTVTLLSCSREQSQNLLEYQSKAVHQVTLEVNGSEYRVEIDTSVPDCALITVSSPEYLSGFSLYVSPNGAELERDGVRVPLQIKGLLKHIPAMFSLDESMIEKVDKEAVNGVDCLILTAKTNGINITLTLKQNGCQPLELKAQSDDGSMLEITFENADTQTY